MESNAEEDLSWLLRAAYEYGMQHGFTVASGRPPNAKDKAALVKVAEATSVQMEASLRKVKG